jgi:hypothetical protein
MVFLLFVAINGLAHVLARLDELQPVAQHAARR